LGQNAAVRFGLLAVVGGVLAAGIAFVILQWADSGSKQAACAPVELTPAGRQTLAGYAGRIEHDVVREPGGSRTESWTDPTTGRTRTVNFGATGQIKSELESVERGRSSTLTMVDYGGRNWIVQHAHGRPALLTAAGLSAEYRRDVGLGLWTVLGRASVDRRATVHLQQIQNLPAPRLPKGVTIPRAQLQTHARTDVWVDALTYVPVRIDSTIDGSRSRTDEAWLPRTPANVAAAELVVPRAFKRLTPGAASSQVFTELSTAPPRCRRS
jgi:hypothetical protein